MRFALKDRHCGWAFLWETIATLPQPMLKGCHRGDKKGRARRRRQSPWIRRSRRGFSPRPKSCWMVDAIPWRTATRFAMRSIATSLKRRSSGFGRSVKCFRCRPCHGVLPRKTNLPTILNFLRNQFQERCKRVVRPSRRRIGPSYCRRARAESDESARKALAAFCEAYWPPLYTFLRRRGYSPADAQDLVQGFFEHLLQQNTLSRADQEKGRLRTFLLGSLQNFLLKQRERMSAMKRGGGAADCVV